MSSKATRARFLALAGAMLGKCSEISIRGTLVLIGLHAPLISRGPSGLRSNMSWWGGPPGRKIMMMSGRGGVGRTPTMIVVAEAFLERLNVQRGIATALLCSGALHHRKRSNI